MTPDQYRRAPIPADGRTIEAMRLALLDTPVGRAMTNAGDTRLYWMNESDAYMLMSPFGIESPFINTTDDALAKARAEIERLRRMLDLRGTGPAERYWEGRWRDEAADNERLREALTKINVGDGWAAQIARAALAQKGGDGK